MLASDGDPGEVVWLEGFAEAEFTTQVLGGVLEVSSLGVALSVGASGIGVSAIEMPGREASGIGGLAGREVSAAVALTIGELGVGLNVPSPMALMMGLSNC